jgi:hypothetical protein
VAITTNLAPAAVASGGGDHRTEPTQLLGGAAER